MAEIVSMLILLVGLVCAVLGIIFAIRALQICRELDEQMKKDIEKWRGNHE